MNLGVRLLEALEEIDSYKTGYPPYWKQKSREKLEILGLVVNQYANIPDSQASYVLTVDGKNALEESKGR